jgi:phospholipase C
MNIRKFPAFLALLGATLAGVLNANANLGTIQDIKHVVILMQENHSFDNYFGTLKGVRGYNDPNILLFQNGSSDLFELNGTNVTLPFPLTNSCYNYGEMLYYTRTNIPFYYALAESYTICDENFCSFLGPTFPNRIYLFSGMDDPYGKAGGPIFGDSIPTNGLHWTTYPERLQAAGVSWRVYRGPADWYGDALQWFAQYQTVTNGNPLYDRGIADVPDVVGTFAADVTNGTLPQVSWIIPQDGTWSEHPCWSTDRGETFVQRVLSVIAANPEIYQSTVFILTYDEGGGFFDHVLPPVAPPGTTNEYSGRQSMGLGVRVPMMIISPWTRGGRVCSQVFDHTSVIRFLEAWTGVQEPNISAWRRQVCGDLTSAFSFANPDYSLPNLPQITTASCAWGGNVYPPVTQTYPVQESGVRTACPLPYQPDAYCTTDSNSNRLHVTITNAGTASVHVDIYPNAYRNDGPWHYDTPGGGLVADSFAQPSNANGGYDFTCYGPNGFQRRFAGKLQKDCNQIETGSQIDPVGGDITLTLLNSGTNTVNYTVTDNLNGPATNVYALAPAGTTNCVFLSVSNNAGWYDLTVTADVDTNFVRHLAGHIENGAFSSSEIPCIVGNTLKSSNGNFSTNGIGVTGIGTGPDNDGGGPTITNTPGAGPVINSISDEVNYLIAQKSLAIAGTNNLGITLGMFGTNCALIYPGWASNFVVESSATLAPPVWTPASGAVTTVSNCNVVILPSSSGGQFFRLRQ